MPASDPAATAANNLALRQALAQFTTGVAIVTTISPQGAPVGMTINSFSSVSLEPPLVLWSVSRQANSFAIFRSAKRYLIHILAATQLDLAKRFATRGADRFSAQSTTAWQYTATRLPRLDDCLAWFECRHRSEHEEGDHVILVGHIEAFHAAPAPPLAFHGGRYFTRFTESPLPQALQSPWVAPPLPAETTNPAAANPSEEPPTSG